MMWQWGGKSDGIEWKPLMSSGGWGEGELHPPNPLLILFIVFVFTHYINLFLTIIMYKKGFVVLNRKIICKRYNNFPSYIFLYFNTKPYICSFHLKPKSTNGRLKTNGFMPQTHNRTQQQKNTQNMAAMVPPAHHLPAASNKELSKFTISWAINLDCCNTAM